VLVPFDVLSVLRVSSHTLLGFANVSVR
jgi:hypothetical protein